MISLCTGRPPGEFTETARATALDVLIYKSLLAIFSVLFLFNLLQILIN